MLKLFLTFILCIVFMGCSNDSADRSINAQANPTTEQTTFPSLTETEQDAYETLLTTAEFAGTAVGFAGSVPRQVPAFQEILNSENAPILFAQLQQDATLEGQIYSLCGLYLSDKEQFDNLIPAYQNNHNEVRTFFGCIMSDVEIAELVVSIEDGYWPTAFQNCSE